MKALQLSLDLRKIPWVTERHGAAVYGPVMPEQRAVLVLRRAVLCCIFERGMCCMWWWMSLCVWTCWTAFCGF